MTRRPRAPSRDVRAKRLSHFVNNPSRWPFRFRSEKLTKRKFMSHDDYWTCPRGAAGRLAPEGGALGRPQAPVALSFFCSMARFNPFAIRTHNTNTFFYNPLVSMCRTYNDITKINADMDVLNH
ncbi:hypothetical protein EVAR_95532_1 [Eumeta japonica]|uniref:Uncharacterized protein n=1 Tax=Eumeta variegata TaxID=151549 RepID=A0A4C1UJ56_EUMVA|nr:hypothetical protein EVAR_95532_1 [Eumeta japonica]